MNFNQASVRGVLRAVVGAYIIYLGFSLLKPFFQGEPVSNPALSIVFGILFILAGGAFLVYAWTSYRRDSARETGNPGGELPDRFPADDPGKSLAASEDPDSGKQETAPVPRKKTLAEAASLPKTLSVEEPSEDAPSGPSQS